MKPGTPGFFGERLVEAREARCLTGVALADLIGVNRTTITHYEKNSQTPQPRVMQRITEVLNLPIEFFLRAPTPPTSGVIFYRSLSPSMKAIRRSAERRHEWFRQIILWLRDFVDLPVISFPDCNPPADPNLIDHAFIEACATEARRFWKMGDGPIPNVAWLLEACGAPISLSDFGTEDIDAFSEHGQGHFEPNVSLSSDKRLAARSNFNAAHELGHLVLHRNIPRQVANRSADHKLIEAQAHSFASTFLLPAATFASQFRHVSLEAFVAMKSQWRVSIASMIMRAKSLFLIDEDRFRRLWVVYSKRGWRQSEPLDDELSYAGPRLARRSFELLINERIVSRQQILNSLPFSSSDVEKLCGLGEGFLSSDYSSNMVTLPTNRTATTSGIKTGTVVPFDRVRKD